MLNKNVDLDQKTILITGCSGFIGAALTNKLLHFPESVNIVGVDSMNDYYGIELKEYRLNELLKTSFQTSKQFIFLKGNIADKGFVDNLFLQYMPDIVIHLAAQAGVRYSIDNPDAYIESNLIGFFNVLEGCRYRYNNKEIEHFIFASSSSVYGNNKKVPYSTKDKTNHPVSLYAATKMADELLAYAYAKLYKIPTTGLRFFTVYGPAGRPDMAYFDFANKLVSGKTIEIFNYGNCKRDFTYVEDVVEGVIRVMQKAPKAEQKEDGMVLPPYIIYNIGNNKPENLLDFVTVLQEELIHTNILPKDYDFESHKEFVPMQPGDVAVTYADTSALERDFGFKPSTDIREGLHKFAEWYADFLRGV